MALNKDAMLRELLSVFAAEARERLEVLGQHLLTLERAEDPTSDTELLTDIKRELHSIKGSGASVGLEDVATVSHELESVIGKVEVGTLPVESGLLDTIYSALDAIGERVRGVASDQDGELDVQGISERLRSIGEGKRGQAKQKKAVDGAGVSVYGKQIQQPEQAGAPAASTNGETVRVSTAKLDSLMANVGELLMARIGAEERVGELRAIVEALEEWEQGWRKVRGHQHRAPRENGSPSLALVEEGEVRLKDVRARLQQIGRHLETDNRRMSQVTSELQDDVRRTRMLPVSAIFNAFPRMVRDLGRELSKAVNLVVEGGETEVDRSVLDQIRAPLTHLLRNAVDHGIESPEARQIAEKPREGTIRLQASQRGGTLQILVSDDGAGIDRDGLKASAVERGLVTLDAARAMGDREAVALIFRSGLSTSRTITDVSGRGVGLDVVRESIERVQGIIDVESEHGRGTTFTLKLPVSVATTQCLLVKGGAQTFGIPIANVSRTIRVGREEIEWTQGTAAVRLEDGAVTIMRLTDILQIPSEADGAQRGRELLVIVGSADRRVGLVIDDLAGAQEMVIKSLPKPFVRVRHCAGATVTGIGEVVLILNVADLIRSQGGAAAKGVTASQAAESEAGSGIVLVVDDSMVTRMLEKSILEAAGYVVRLAGDGVEAWNMLQNEGCDLLVTDVNMPRMGGFDLTAKVRADERLKDLPVVLVTSLDSADDHARGIEVGADAYIVKSAFSQDRLLETVSRLI